LKRIFVPKKDEVRGEWRKLHNEKLRDLYSSSTIVRMIKSRMMGGSGSAYGGGERYVQDFGGKT
jgi:hypothetical protein